MNLLLDSVLKYSSEVNFRKKFKFWHLKIYLENPKTLVLHQVSLTETTFFQAGAP